MIGQAEIPKGLLYVATVVPDTIDKGTDCVTSVGHKSQHSPLVGGNLTAFPGAKPTVVVATLWRPIQF